MQFWDQKERSNIQATYISLRNRTGTGVHRLDTEGAFPDRLSESAAANSPMKIGTYKYQAGVARVYHSWGAIQPTMQEFVGNLYIRAPDMALSGAQAWKPAVYTR